MPNKKKAKEDKDPPQQPKPPPEGTPYSYSVLDDPNRAKTTQEIISTVAGRRKNRTLDFKTAAEVRVNTIPMNNLLMQNAMGTYGLPHASLIEIIGAEGLGKTSLTLQMAGWAMRAGCPSLYIRCESKQMQPHRMMRCLDSDPEMAQRMMDALDVTSAKYLGELEEKIEDWSAVQRGLVTGNKGSSVSVPMDTPLLIIADPWGKLLNKAEASGNYDWGALGGTAAKKSKAKAVGEASNLGHAQFAHGWARRMGYLLPDRNIVLVLVHHQNEKIDMGAFSPVSTGALFNKTKIGGKAFNQTSALQFILARKGLAKTGDRVTGTNVDVRVEKNSVGPNNRKFGYEIRTEIAPGDDYPGFQQPAVVFDKYMADWFVTQKLLGTTVTSGRYTCEALGIAGRSATELTQALYAHPEVLHELGDSLGIEGYVNLVDRIAADTATDEPKPEEES